MDSRMNLLSLLFFIAASTVFAAQGSQIGMKNITALAGKDKRIILSCPFMKFIRVKWKQNGRLVKHSKRILFSMGTITISSVRRSDEGQYTCESRDFLGHFYEAVFNVIVNETPRILKRTRRNLYKTGSTAIIDCEANGKPKPNVFWVNERGYSPISPPRITRIGESSLRIKNLQKNDSSVLICVAQNMHGRAKAKFTIHAAAKRMPPIVTKKIKPLEAPVFKNLPRRVIYAKFGETLKIDCTASGNPKPLVSIVRSHPFRYALNGNTIKIARQSHSGRYDCIAENSKGKIKFPFLIRVSARSRTKFQIAKYKQSFIKTRGPTRPVPNRRTQNYRRPTRPVLNRRTQSYRQPTRKVSRPSYGKRKSTYGRYRGYFTSWTNWSKCAGQCGIGSRERTRRCRIKSPRYARIFCKGPKQTKQPCVLRKCDSPKIVKFSYDASDEKNLLLECIAKGYPQPEIKWQIDNKYTSLKTSKIAISLKVAKSARYSCFATNKAGTNQVFVNIDL